MTTSSRPFTAPQGGITRKLILVIGLANVSVAMALVFLISVPPTENLFLTGTMGIGTRLIGAVLVALLVTGLIVRALYVDLVRPMDQITERMSRTPWTQHANTTFNDPPLQGLLWEHRQLVLAIEAAKQWTHKDFASMRSETAKRKQIESELTSSIDKLRRTTQEQAEFTYALSHDLKAPNTTVQMLLEEAELELENGDLESVRQFLSAAKRTSCRMSHLITDVLAFTSAGSGNVPLSFVNLNQLMVSVVEDINAEVRAAKANILVGPLPDIVGSRGQLQLLFLNLVTNAIKYRAKDRPCEIRISGVLENGRRDVRIEVSDNGIGIEKQFYTRIFGLFKRLHSHEDYPGSGLGLATCRRVVSNHQGQITITSEPGTGSTFHIWLPGAAASEQDLAA